MKYRLYNPGCKFDDVALFTRAWIEIADIDSFDDIELVALFTRAWIEIYNATHQAELAKRRPLHEGVD